MLGKEPVFSKEECEQIIKLGKSLPQEDAKIYKETQEDAKTYKETQEGKKDYTIRQTDISWIPFERMPKMYARLLEWGLRFNNNYLALTDSNLQNQHSLHNTRKGIIMIGTRIVPTIWNISRLLEN